MESNHSRLVVLTLAFALLVIPTTLHAGMRYEGIKFWVYRTERPDSFRLWRLRLADGSRLYTTDRQEVDQLVASKGRAIEPMDAFVMRKPLEKMVRLYRFDQTVKPGTVRHFYAAFAPEAKIVASQSTSRARDMHAHVYPHDIQPQGELARDIHPVHCFYDAETGEHFYTTSEKEKNSLTGAASATPAHGATVDGIKEASHELATIALGRPAKASDKLLKQFERSLRSIRRSYPDLPPKEIAATIFAAHKQLKKFGKPLPLEKVAPLIAISVPRNLSPESRIGLNDIAASFVGGYVGGDYEGKPKQAATDARALMEALLDDASTR